MSQSSQGKWSKSSWKSLPALQQPNWPDKKALADTLSSLEQLPALVFAGESRSLKQDLAEAAEGNAFVLQAGDCAEDFSRCHGPFIHNLLKVILQMAVTLTYSGERKVVKIGRIAGQYAKPRSSEFETIGGAKLPSYRGDIVNSPEPTLAARTPDPRRILEGYFRATATLNLVRAFTSGGYAALDHVHSWSEASYRSFPENEKYEELVRGIRKTIDFMSAIGINSHSPQFNQVTLYTSHEALLLGYEEALTRIDTTTGDWYDTSANMLWIGDRTRQPDGAHVEFLRGVNNPLGVKIGPEYDLDDIKRVIEKLNPENEAGRLSLITRFGSKKINDSLPPLIKAVEEEGARLTWICDPMHGNTYANQDSIKTRKYDDILSEIRSFWEIHKSEGTVAGGVHLELTGEDVTECSGGMRDIDEKDLHLNYQSNCDPRLNAEQAVGLAFELAEIMHC